MLIGALAFALILVGSAAAGYPVRPFPSGETITADQPTFIVYLDEDASLPFVYVGSDPQMQRLVGSCVPITPIGEPHKFSCRIRGTLPFGKYYWTYSYWRRDDCRPFLGTTICYQAEHKSEPMPFELQERARPVDTAGLPSLAKATSVSHTQPFYGQITSALSKQSAEVRCWAKGDWVKLHDAFRFWEGGGAGLTGILGYVRLDEKTVIHLAPDICGRLDLLVYQRKRPQGAAKLDVAKAVLALTHESMHVFGITSDRYDDAEARANCFAYQLMTWTGQQLGLLPAYARELTMLAWSHDSDWPSQYQSADCYDGGLLDLNKTSSIWP
jgi:hypothetical protein